MPLVWSVPEALVTAELATCFPSNAGFVDAQPALSSASFAPKGTDASMRRPHDTSVS